MGAQRRESPETFFVYTVGSELFSDPPCFTLVRVCVRVRVCVCVCVCV